MKYPFVILFLIVAQAAANADPIADGQSIRSLYQGALSIDPANSASFLIETLIPNQEVELQLAARPLSTSAYDALTLPFFSTIHTMSSVSLVPVSFAHFRVFIDGCNISSQVASLCNAASCWLNNPATPHPIGLDPSTADLGTDFSMAIPIALNSASFSACPAGTFSGFTNDSQYQVTFAEALTDNCPAQNTGGRVAYQISVRSFSPTPTKVKGN